MLKDKRQDSASLQSRCTLTFEIYNLLYLISLDCAEIMRKRFASFVLSYRDENKQLVWVHQTNAHLALWITGSTLSEVHFSQLHIKCRQTVSAESPWYIKYNKLHFCACIMLVRRGHHDDITAWCHGWLQCVRWHNVTLWRDIEISTRATIWLQQHRRTASNFKSSSLRVYWVGGLWNRAVLS